MISILTNCPNCDSTLIRVKDQLYCHNTSCSAKSAKMMLHYLKTMKIKGLGEKTLDKLNLDSITSLYDLTKDQFIAKLGEKIGNKLYIEVTNSRNIDLSTYIAAFGIPLIGKCAAEKLAISHKTIWDITTESAKKSGLGEKAIHNIVSWVIENKDKYINIPITFKDVKVSENIQEVCTVVITGKLKEYASRSEASKYLNSIGIKVVSSLSNKVKYLVCEVDSSSSSYTKAKKMNIPIITMKQLIKNYN